MSTRTTNYDLIICEGTDVVNPLTQIFPNFTSLDDILRAIANTGITTATELVTGTVHALTRSDANVSVFRFQATSNFTAGETFTVDGAQVTALDVSGETLRTGAYIIGSMVLCELRDTLLTVYVSGSSDAETLEGHAANYFATATGLATVDGKANANKLLIDGLTENLNDLTTIVTVTVVTDSSGLAFIGGIDGYTLVSAMMIGTGGFYTVVTPTWNGTTQKVEWYIQTRYVSNDAPLTNATNSYRLVWIKG